MEQNTLMQMVQRCLVPCTPTLEHVQHPMPAHAQVVQPSMRTSSRDHVSRQQSGLDATLAFFKAKARLESEATIAGNGGMEFNIQQQGGPYTQKLVDHSPLIASREPIIEQDYILTEDDTNAAAFVEMSYDNAMVVDIGQHPITVKYLRKIVNEEFMSDEVRAVISVPQCEHANTCPK